MKATDRRKGKGLLRSLTRKGVAYDKSPAVAQRAPLARREAAFKEGSACERCGAVFARKKWSRPQRISHERLAAAAWVICPACAQARSGIAYGKLIVSGAFARDNLDLIRRRIANVERRAGSTQPERRILSADFDGEKLEILTTSQKLAHRIARELEKLFGGRAKYNWSSEDGSLFATWKREAR